METRVEQRQRERTIYRGKGGRKTEEIGMYSRKSGKEPRKDEEREYT